jgi:FKBP-type peptidyl-prolyl cis-trans isomerase SlyD
MQIAKQKVVILDYTLKNDTGEILDQSQGGSFAYLHGAGNIISGLENALADKSPGDTVSVRIPPEEAYGQRNEDMRQTVEIGQQFHAQSPSGQMLTVTVTGIEEDHITVDANHPLAGEHLNFDVQIVDVRDASDEELAHGHVHGPGGHHH